MRRAAPVLLALALLLGCGCEGGSAAPEPIRAEGVSVCIDYAEYDETAAQAAYADFAVDLLRAGRREGENVLVSPLSVTLALGMTSVGAAGDTAGQLYDLFGGTLAPHCQALMARYADLGGSSETNLVNSLWCDPDLALSDTFAAVCRDHFGAQLFRADLQSADTVRAVNDWVREGTRGRISKVADRFDARAALAIVNAVYFKNQFERPFATPAREWTIDFHNADGTVSQPQGMSNGEREERYLTHEGGRGVALPYDDGKLGLLLMLPDEDLSLTDYLAGWDGGTIRTLLESQTETRVELTVPKFRTEWGDDLKEALMTLGITDAFDPEAADFTPMGRCEDGSLYVDSVVHKTAFELNEKGTEAAAVTAVIMCRGTAMPPEDRVVLRFDRPFVYGIVDLDTGAPLFLGAAERLRED